MILAGDIGGTKTLLAVFSSKGGRLECLRERSFPSEESASLEAMVRSFLADGRERITRCAVGVAGPVIDGRSEVVNLRWPVDGKRLARVLGLTRVFVLNDLEATGWGLGELPPRSFASLTPRLHPRPGNAALIAAGTGLGTAILHWDGRRHLPSSGEGGHQGFPPRDDVEIDLLRALAREHGRASLDRVVSGPGLSAVFRLLTEAEGGEVSPALAARMSTGDPNAAIAEAGLAGVDETARRALDRFVSLYGAAAGDLALVAGAVGGIYVAGGIAPKILPRLRSGPFMEAFRSKGRLRPWLERVPVRVVLEPRTALLGAAARAARDFPQPLAAPPRGETR